MKAMRQPTAGFTLIEILVVAAMVGILAEIAAPSWVALVKRQRVSAVQGRILHILRETQFRARQEKVSYSASFRMNNQLPQAAVHRTGQTATNWQPLWGVLKPGQISIASNSPNNTVAFDFRGTIPEGTRINATYGISFSAYSPDQPTKKKCTAVTTLLGTIRTSESCP